MKTSQMDNLSDYVVEQTYKVEAHTCISTYVGVLLVFFPAYLRDRQW